MTKLDLAELLGVEDVQRHQERVAAALRNAAATDNPYLQQPMERLLGAQSKRLRSGLVMAVVASQGKPIDKQVIQACAAIELVHMASLVHDDIIDQAPMRGSVATVNSMEGVHCAILVGDYLFAQAGVLAAQVSAQMAELIETTIVQLCDGEARELADQYNMDRTQQSLFKAIMGKTGALMAAACQAGGLCTGSSAGEVLALRSFGLQFGAAFQLLDDLLDFVSTPQLIGKQVGADVREGVYTWPVLHALSSTNGTQLRKLLLGKHDVTALLVRNGSLTQSLDLIIDYNQRAVVALKGTTGTKKLAQLPGNYTKWALQNLVSPQYKTLTQRFVGPK
jgi:heptaprenyl diphosphate synthase/octaprenyl-diphosphate synthase